MKKMFGDSYMGMLLIMIAGTFLNPQYFFLLSIGYYSLLLVNSKFRMAKPHIPGFGLYITVILYGTIVGLLMYGTRSVVRDLYYEILIELFKMVMNPIRKICKI